MTVLGEKNININMDDRTRVKKGSAILAILICRLYYISSILAKKIVDKEIKIPSSTIYVIKKMQELIDNKGSVNIVNQKRRVKPSSAVKKKPRGRLPP